MDQIAGQLRRLHQFRAEDIPHFAAWAPWRERVMADIEGWWQEAMRRGDFPRARLERIRACIDEYQWSVEQAPPAVLTHCDIHGENVLFDRGMLSGLVDFDDADIGLVEMECWMLAGVMIDDGYAPADEVLGWLRSSFPEIFQSAGCKERFAIFQISEILWNLTQAKKANWTTQEEGLVEAGEHYERLFESDYYARWFGIVFQ
jgi:thiamine kinase-like enzyme